VLTVDQREGIRRAYYVDGKSIRQIAREGHHDRRTVRKALRDAGPPRYTLQQSRARPVLGRYVPFIDRWLEEDLSQPPKQRHTARRIYYRLVEEHSFRGSESTVREYVRKHRPRARSLFIPLAYEPGQDAQCDFGEGWIVLRGCRITAQILCMRLCFSKIPFVMVFPHQRQEAFFEGQKEAFAFFAGVPHIIWYDRLTQAVKQTLVGRKPREQESFIAFRSHFLFESRFCTPGEAHEKGLVENLVGYARRNFLVPLPQVNSFQELNTILRERCLAEAGRRLRGESLTVGELWSHERPHLHSLPSRPFPCCRTLPVRPNRLSLVTFETNRYSVPVEHAHYSLFLRAFVDKVEITDGTKLIATHARCYEREQDILDVLHYLPLLRERPGALDYAKAFKSWARPAILDRYLEALRERLPHRIATINFLEVLEMTRSHPIDAVARAVEQALAMGSIVPETVKYLLRSRNSPSQLSFLPLLVSTPASPRVQDRDLRQYDLLLRR
jgi:transposase